MWRLSWNGCFVNFCTLGYCLVPKTVSNKHVSPIELFRGWVLLYIPDDEPVKGLVQHRRSWLFPRGVLIVKFCTEMPLTNVNKYFVLTFIYTDIAYSISRGSIQYIHIENNCQKNLYWMHPGLLRATHNQLLFRTSMYNYMLVKLAKWGMSNLQISVHIRMMST